MPGRRRARGRSRPSTARRRRWQSCARRSSSRSSAPRSRPSCSTTRRCAAGTSTSIRPGASWSAARMGDAGLTGRKIIVDTYGGMAPARRRRLLRQGSDQGRPLGGVRGRWVAKNIVAAGLARRCELQVAYAIGVAQPGQPERRDVRHAHGRPRGDRGRCARALRSPPGGDHERSRSAPPDLPRRRRPTGTSAVSRRGSPGSAPTAPRRWGAQSADRRGRHDPGTRGRGSRRPRAR